ncbi:MAG: hypothetical protein DWQ34_04570 [Planctomycetota bacterium]|nr:MAG: hypothetical protein DWQ34_04570 [Planctomycetota bacterium]REK21089.1 MAG: hypothetical protein DWQ41_22715 [Planctomycetota bacterium]REK28528.1 MAG: hypothetical protein DWQ45_24435 [Planctomycetota bacterium]
MGVFDVDASPPVGSPLAYDPTEGVQTPLSCRGIVVSGAGEPIVLCAVDWIGIGNAGNRAFREALAVAVGTSAERVAVHTLHQHDAPRCDFDADDLVREQGLGGVGFDPGFARDVIHRAADAVERALANASPVTHVGTGSGVVEKVASNRRILGPDGMVLHTRWTATRDPVIAGFPAGTIDPEVKLISFWNGDEAIVALTYYACHPQSYYRTGLANPDFPGLARNARQEETGVPHVHFNGAGGNIGAGKWNDGSKENRQVLADRVAEGMKLAWENTEKTPIGREDVGWGVEPVVLPPAEHLSEESLLEVIQDEDQKSSTRFFAAVDLTWLRRCRAGDTIEITCLSAGPARLLHMPGELFVEYQLAAQKLRPDLFVAMAAYGDYAPGYIGTEVAYTQGGYETSARASQVAPEVEAVLMSAVASLLEAEEQADSE